MLSWLESVPIESVASLAALVDVNEPTVGRSCRSLGYANFKGLKDHSKRDLGDKPWLISGCAFTARCPAATDARRRARPALETQATGRVVACFHPLE